MGNDIVERSERMQPYKLVFYDDKDRAAAFADFLEVSDRRAMVSAASKYQRLGKIARASRGVLTDGINIIGTFGTSRPRV